MNMKPKVREAKQTHLIAASLGLLAVFIFAADASAYYHPTLGRFMSRDPGSEVPTHVATGGISPGGRFVERDPYEDGMSLHQYERGNPVHWQDPSGLKILVCRSPVFGIIGNHFYFYDDVGEQSCGRSGSSGLGETKNGFPDGGESGPKQA